MWSTDRADRRCGSRPTLSYRMLRHCVEVNGSGHHCAGVVHEDRCARFTQVVALMLAINDVDCLGRIGRNVV